MKIAYISPRDLFAAHNPSFREFWQERTRQSTHFGQNWFGMAYGLLVLAALTPPEHDVELIDENFEPIDFDRDYDLVAISSLTGHSSRAYAIADEFRKRRVTVVLGGIHVTVLPEEGKRHADSVVVGEAEYVWPDVLADLRSGSLKPRYQADRLVDMKDSPLPRFDLIAGRKYRSINIQTARGCPHDCEFCLASNVYGRRYRQKSIDQVLNEIAEVQRLMGNPRISFGDDNLLVNRTYSREFLSALKGMNVRYYVQSDISIAEDDDLLELLRTSGCINVLIGFESIYPEALRGIDKGGWKLRQLKNYPEYIRRIQSKGIGVYGTFMVGLDSDDDTVFARLADFVIDNNIFEAQITAPTPLPGTRLRARLEQEGRLLPLPWDHYTMVNMTYTHPRLTKQRIEEGLAGVWKTVNSSEAIARKKEHFKAIQKQLLLKDAGRPQRV